MLELDKSYISDCLFEDNTTLFFTLTNEGYIDYTFNMIESLKRFNIDKKLFIFCLDESSNNILRLKGYKTFLINTNLSAFTAFNEKGYDKICYIKFLTIYKIIELGYNAFYTDGDIFFNKNPFEYILKLKNIDGDIWIQNDSLTDNDYSNVCAGFMYVRSNDITKKYFECESAESIKKYNETGLKPPYDQAYFNKHIKSYLNLHMFPLSEFPNGRYFYKFSEKIQDTIVMVHFNWIIGHEKKKRMQKYNMWLESKQ